MTPQGQPTTSALQALVQDGTLTGPWILDPARSEVRLESRHTSGSARSRRLRPGHRQRHGDRGRRGHRHPHGRCRVDRHEEQDARQGPAVAQARRHANHPDITYTVDSMQPASGGVQVTGSLTVRGRTRPLSFDAKVSAAAGEVRLDAEVPVNRADFGLSIQPAAHRRR